MEKEISEWLKKRGMLLALLQRFFSFKMNDRSHDSFEQVEKVNLAGSKMMKKKGKRNTKCKKRFTNVFGQVVKSGFTIGLYD